MPQTMTFHYHFAPDAAMQDAASMQRFLTTLVDLGYVIQGIRSADDEVGSVPATTPGIADSVAADLRHFADGAMSTLWLHAAPQTTHPALNGIHCGIAFHATWRTSMIALTISSIQFRHQPAARLVVRDHWLALFAAMCRVWKMRYAHSAKPTSTWPEPQDADLDQGRLTALYDMNYLGAPLVDQIGRKHLLATPAWQVQPVLEGGVLLFPQALFDDHDPQRWQKVMRHLGMTAAFTGLLDEG